MAAQQIERQVYRERGKCQDLASSLTRLGATFTPKADQFSNRLSQRSVCCLTRLPPITVPPQIWDPQNNNKQRSDHFCVQAAGVHLQDRINRDRAGDKGACWEANRRRCRRRRRRSRGRHRSRCGRRRRKGGGDGSCYGKDHLSGIGDQGQKSGTHQNIAGRSAIWPVAAEATSNVEEDGR